MGACMLSSLQLINDAIKSVLVWHVLVLSDVHGWHLRLTWSSLACF